MQANPPPPMINMNTSSGRQNVPLRDYLNARIAPFLKKAMTESIGSEAEFPLQWLGEHLIHQSLLYENNPDATNIRERFRYNFDAPAAQQPVAEDTKVNGSEPIATQDAATFAAATVSVPPPPDATMTNSEGGGQQAATGGDSSTGQADAPAAITDSEDVNMADPS
ncbi:uncharacterized protein AB675_7128 [Cyphellophora attinorum]|uniref:Uncharacterized protein n=1 Tax=Cyphellophora attinorum TaxID=1664694 RepID=A0A0N1HV64_9EURO|nr:uncharacterized protein AB675_7128 [Phialophora attinorum]KPI43543.1 hypothetical protein AB675_7128 [Phialophora attinorum]